MELRRRLMMQQAQGGGDTPSVYEIWYTTTDGQPVMSGDGFVASNTLVSNVSDGEKCIATYENPITNVGIRGFYGLSTLQSVILPDTPLYVSAYAFAFCEALQSVVFPSTITGGIFTSTFERCTSLSSVIIPDGATEIGNWAFERCLALPASIELPSTITSLKYAAFNITYIRDVTIKNTTAMVTSASAMFSGGMETIIRVPSALLSSYQADQYWSQYTLVGY